MLTAAFSSGVLAPPRFGLLGFDTLRPAQAALFAAAARGESVQMLHWASSPAEPPLLCARDLQQEVGAAAAWVREQLEAEPGCRIGVIVPDLGPVRPEIERVFRKVLTPESAAITVTDSDPPFEFSLGLPLCDVPLVRAALLVLRWLAEPISHAECTWLVLSGFLVRRSDDDQRGQAALELAQWNAQQRKDELLPLDVELSGFLALSGANTWAARALRRQLRTALARFARQGQPASFGSWGALARRLLDDAGWSGKRAADSATFQAQRAWEGALDQIASLDFSGGAVPYRAFLDVLQRLASQTIFAPESLGAPVQVMGALESSGQAFDALWFMGADDVAWPAAGQPNPLLPLWLQKQSRMPHADAAADWRLCADVTARLLTSAQTIVCSHARGRDGAEVRPSPLLRHLPLHQAEPAVPVAVAGSATVLEFFDDDAIIPWPVEQIAGGKEVLAQQAACPFRAFASKRLGAHELGDASHGLSSQQRGVVLHEVLQRVWSKDAEEIPHLRSRDCLFNAEADGRLGRLVESHTAQALEKFRKRAREPWEKAYLEAERERIVNLALEWLRFEQNRVPFAIADCETSLKTSVGELQLSLRVDRIDAVAGGHVLLDYKTSKVSTGGWEGERPEDPQLPLYAVFGGIDKVVGALFAQVRAGEPGFLGCVEDVRTQLMQDAPNHKKLAENPYSEETRAEWERILLALSHSFVRGEAFVDPKEYPGTCKYCALKGLCRVAETDVALRENADAEAEPGNDPEFGQEIHE